jgi:hypothetical protein
VSNICNRAKNLLREQGTVRYTPYQAGKKIAVTNAPAYFVQVPVTKKKKFYGANIWLTDEKIWLTHLWGKFYREKIKKNPHAVRKLDRFIAVNFLLEKSLYCHVIS